ncbi:POT family MFS transporter [Rubritalea marina]|uniref:POT family MFS transporter n=1 Tax=Rubritalea marina TaxID=361055 RepID=UPI0003709777|nr:POT family MFS transporter [Rubritalea marina]
MYRSSPSDTSELPKGIPYIVVNEAAERFSFYGMKAALVIFMTQYLHLLGDKVSDPMSSAKANENVHWFVLAIYLTPVFGAILSDRFLGKYKTIISLSIVYCLGHLCLAYMGVVGPAAWWLLAGLGLIAIGGGGIKPCVSAHVGDQFGPNNQHLITKAFNWFYFSINLGAAISNVCIPWILKWYGPHWAFGIPGALMALATLVFWMGRHSFIHIPPAGKEFTREIFSWKGIKTLFKLCSVFSFTAIFWALFDQTASTWVFQAIDMDRTLFGIEILPSQVQAANPFMILLLIPIFTYVLYPAVDRLWKFTSLRKIGVGLFLTAAAFALSALTQEWIDAGQEPSIAWQILAYLMLTSAEVMVSIVCLEFAYTQAPNSMKSMVMSLFLITVALGNGLTAIINNYIQTPSPLANEAKDASILLSDSKVRQSSHQEQLYQHDYPGFDQKIGTPDDISIHFNDLSAVQHREVPAHLELQAAAALIQDHHTRQLQFPSSDEGQAMIADLQDPWGSMLSYRLLNGKSFRIQSIGPDQKPLSQWDTGLIVTYEDLKNTNLSTTQKQSWLDQRKAALGLTPSGSNSTAASPYHYEFVAGGFYKLEGAAYFWFFTYLMLGSAVLFIPVSLLYKDDATS